jgi:hypothetical protein
MILKEVSSFDICCFSIKKCCGCKRNKIAGANLNKIVDKLLSIEYIWNILLYYDCKRKESIININ